MKIFKFGAAGRIRVKGESLAPTEWKRSLWDKLKNNDLFTPINIHDESNIREIKFFFNKKVFVIGINLFLFTFIYSFTKDVFQIMQARQNIININKIDFSKKLPNSIINDHNNLIKSSSKNSPDLQAIIQNNNKWIVAMTNLLKENYWEVNFQTIKSTIWPLTNDFLILLMISKYYWKRKKY